MTRQRRLFAEGNVKIVQGDETILTTRAEGNMKTGDVWLKQGGTLQEPDTTMNGEWSIIILILRPVRSSKLTAKVPKTILKHLMQRFIRINSCGRGWTDNTLSCGGA